MWFTDLLNLSYVVLLLSSLLVFFGGLIDDITAKTSPSQPDGYHLHMLIYKRLVRCKRFKHNKTICNSMTSPFLWALSLVGIIPAVIWYDNQTVLIIWAFLFMTIYTIIYRRIVHFKFKFKR